MKKVLFLFALFLLSFGLITQAEASVTEFTGTNVDMGMKLRQQVDPTSSEVIENIKESISKIEFNENVLTTQNALQSNFTYYGGSKYFLGMQQEIIRFHLRSVGEHVEVWVADDLSYAYDRPSDVVTQQHVDQIRDEFDQQIYPTNRAFFGEENFHDGSNAALENMGFPKGYYKSNGKTIILIENIKDPSYYSKTNSFVSGFYWNGLEYFHDLNIVTLDSYGFMGRMPNNNPAWQSIQYDVYGTLAHEFQHLIHDDNDPLESLWIDEGMAGFAQYLNGYGHNMSHVNAFLQQPENSLVYWGDYNSSEILADYGQAYLLQLYLYEQYGQEVVRALAKDPKQGIESLNHILSTYHTGVDFGTLFRNFSIASAIDSNQPGDGIYEFKSIDLKVNLTQAQSNQKPGIPAWGADYQLLNTSSKIDRIDFSGVEFVPTPWQVYQTPNNDVLWNNQGDKMDQMLIFEADLTQLDTATLTFNHLFIIEEYFDYAFVQISLDDGLTWTSLSNENTISQFENWGEYPQIGEQLPGFTGTNSSFKQETFDLSAYTGQKVHIGFRYMTDAHTTYYGWFIDNIMIPELNLHYDGSTLDGFSSLQELTNDYIEYGVAIINERYVGKGRVVYQVVVVDPFNVTETDALKLRQLFKDGQNYMISWYRADLNVVDAIPFEYEIINKK